MKGIQPRGNLLLQVNKARRRDYGIEAGRSMKQRTAKVDWDVLGKDLRKTWNSMLTVGC